MSRSKRCVASNDSIFGTPPEPIFKTHESLGTDRLMLDEWLLTLSQRNALDIQKIPNNENFFKRGNIVENVFLLCDKLQVNCETKYLTLELFNKFMVQHIKDLYNHVKATDSKTKTTDWSSILDRISKQVVLRMVSCLQVASKMTSNYKIVTNTSAVKVLKLCGYHFNNDSVLMSEIRVLKTLNFHINVHSSLTYVETLLELLGKKWPECNVKVSHGICLHLLDIAYIRHTHIYGQLHRIISENTTPSQQEREEFGVVEADKMLLSAGVIVASMWIHDRTHVNKCVEIMEQVSSVPQEDLTDFSTVLIQAILT